MLFNAKFQINKYIYIAKVKATLLESPCTNFQRDTSAFEKIHHFVATNEKLNVSGNVNLMLNTYKYIFFKLLLRIFYVFGQLGPMAATPAKCACTF